MGFGTMKIAMFGAGYVGLVTGACLSDLGNDVTIVDVDSKKVADLNDGIIPIYEPGLSEMVLHNHKEGRLMFTTDASSAVTKNDVIFIAVGTPPKEDGSSDLKYVLSVAETIGKNMKSEKVVVVKSTVPVGTNDLVKETIKKHTSMKFEMASNPEFLREGTAIRDFMVPDRIVIGCESGKVKEIMTDIYEGIARLESPIIYTSIRSAEVTKYAANAMLALRISFMNQLVPLCEHYHADIKEVAKGIGYDNRIGSKFLQAGIGFGGSCFPKDVASLSYVLKDNHFDNSIIQSIIDVNEKQKRYLVSKLKKVLGELHGKKITLWGLSFKQRTDDIREAPSLTIIDELKKLGAKISAYDPEAIDNMKKIHPDIEYTHNPYDCVINSDAVLLVTEWGVFRNLDFERVRKSMKNPNVFDGRNIYEPDEMRERGFNYYSIGRN